MNSQERFRAAADLFLRARGLAPDQIDAYLERACGGDAELTAEVRRLLAARDGASVFETLASRLRPVHDGLREHLPDTHITSIGATLLADELLTPDEQPESRIGHYRLLERIGEGGFGRVWVAEQSEPVRRRVALKIIKAGMDSREVLVRFESERQALAMMDHPNIARIFDAGVTERGRPYFVMEHVPGLPITDFCDANRLRIRQRLDLFVPVCRAVQHAHQRGIIHRDLKPSNILVTLVDGRAAPKVIDFGIAKAISSRLSDHTLHTEVGRMLGTPEYMSPEQADRASADIDTRSDVYSLGVILYQLLTGTTPFDGKMLREAGHDGVIRIIRELDPPKPSTRLSTLMAEPVNRRKGDTPADIADKHGTAPRALQRELAGELDWIVMKCLEKNRARRYETPNELAADILRYLANESVLAAPPNAWYLFSKFVAFHRKLLIFATTVLILTVAGLVGTTIEMVRANRAHEDADRQAASAIAAAADARRAEAAAKSEKAIAQRLAYSGNMLGASSAISFGAGSAASHFLDSAPAELRGWEWRHVSSRLDLADRTHAYPRNGKLRIHPLPDGRSYCDVVSKPAPCIQRRSMETGELLQSIPINNPCLGSWLAADGRQLILVVSDAARRADAIEVWELEHGSRLLSREAEGLAARFGDATSDGTRFAYAWKGRVCVLETRSGELRITDEKGAVGTSTDTVCFQRDGRSLIAFSLTGEALVINPDSFDVVGTFDTRHAAAIRASVCSDDGRLVATATWDRFIHITDLDADLPTQTVTLSGPFGSSVDLRLSPDGTLLAACGSDRTLRLWDTRTGAERGVFASSSTSVAFSPNGQTLICGDDTGVQFWDVRTSDAWVLRGHSSYVNWVLISPDGGTLYSGGADGQARQAGAVRIWDAATGDEIAALGTAGQSTVGACLSPDGSLLALSMRGPPTGSRIDVLDTATGAVVAIVPNAQADTPKFDEQANRLFFTDLSRITFVIADAHTGAIQQSRQLSSDLLEPRGQQNGFGSPYDTVIVACSGMRPTLYLLDGRTLESIRSWPSGHTAPAAVALSPDGRRFVTASYDGTIKVWDTATGRHVHDLVGHVNRVLCAAFSPDGTRIATGGDDTDVHIWDAQTFEPVARLRGHVDYVSSLAWHSDSQVLVSGSADHTARIWDTVPLKDRMQARRARRDILARVEPIVEALFSELGDDGRVAQRIKSDPALDERSRQVALQVVLRESIKRRSASDKTPSTILPSGLVSPLIP